MAKVMYFIIDSNHADFAQIKGEAEAAWKINHPNNNFSWRNNIALTKTEAKVEGFTHDWWEDSPWKGHPMILGVYSNDNDARYSSHTDLLALMNTSEWIPAGEQDDII